MQRQEFTLKQPRLAGLLKGALARGQVAQAYLFWGSPRCDFQGVARFVAQSLFCEKKGLACGECAACVRFKGHIHPDFLEINGFENSIKKDDVAKIKENGGFTTVENASKRMVYLLLECNKLTPEAANALLKFLEEPSWQTAAILTTTNIETVLPTILSRCEVIRLEPLTREEIYAMLSTQYSPEIAYFLTDFSGNREVLVKTAQDDNFMKMASMANDFILSLIENKDEAANVLLTVAATSLSDSKCYNYFYEDVSRFLADAVAQTGLFGPYSEAIREFGAKQSRLAANMLSFLQMSLRMATANLSFTGVLAQLAQMVIY